MPTRARKFLKDSVDEMEECGPSLEVYGNQLELEEVRVETERSREQLENTQYLITMLQGLFAKATTPHEKSEYEAEVVLLMRHTVEYAKLRATLPPPRLPAPCLPPLPRVLRLTAAAARDACMLLGISRQSVSV
jgi:hypothetical protein